MTSNYPQPTRANKFEGFDFLRAFFAVVVVALHANLFNVFVGKPGLNFVSDILNLNLGYLAVPVFLQISLFLFLIKREKVDHRYFTQKRLPKIVSLYTFWVIAKVIFNLLFGSEQTLEQLSIQSPLDLLLFIISGGHTVFYFFFSLLLLTLVAEILVLVIGRSKPTTKLKISYALLLVSSLVVFLFPLIDLSTGNEILTQIVDPINFLPYVFTAMITTQEFHSGRFEKYASSYKLKLLFLALLFLIFAALEWFIFGNLPHSRLFPHYARLSLVLASWALLYLALLSRQKVPARISFLSACSLGIYGFHIFFIEHTGFLEAIPGISGGISILIKFLIALAGSIVLTLLFRKRKWLKNFV